MDQARIAQVGRLFTSEGAKKEFFRQLVFWTQSFVMQLTSPFNCE